MKKTYILEIELPDDPAMLDDPKNSLLDILKIPRERAEALIVASCNDAERQAADIIAKDKADGKDFSTYAFNGLRGALDFLDTGLTGNEVFFLFFQGYNHSLREKNKRNFAM
jgi:hypothetical protein